MDLLAVQGTRKGLVQHHSSKASILRCSAFFTIQLSHPYMTTGNTIALTRWTFVGKVIYLLLNMLSRLVITFLPRSKCLLISWLLSPSAVILEPKKLKADTVSNSEASCFLPKHVEKSLNRLLVGKKCRVSSPTQSLGVISSLMYGCPIGPGSVESLWCHLCCLVKDA